MRGQDFEGAWIVEKFDKASSAIREFAWSSTPQGHDYWAQVWDNLAGLRKDALARNAEKSRDYISIAERLRAFADELERGT